MAATPITATYVRAGDNSNALAWLRRAPLLPALIVVVVTTQLPFLATIVLSFFRWRAFAPDDRGFAGFDNYVTLFGDELMRHAVLVTIVLTVVVVAVSLFLGLAIALLLNHRFLGRGIVRTLMIAPFLIVPIAAALLWKHLLLNPSYGLLNGVLSWVWNLFGSTAPPQPAWLTDYPLISVEIALIWQWTPFMMLILLAGLQSRPPDVLEAARVDGAGPVAIFRDITLPHLRRYLELGGLLGAIYIVQNFDAVFSMTSGSLGTANLPYTIYQTFFQAQDYGLAAAMGVVAVIASLIVSIFLLRTMSSLLKEQNR